VYPTATAALLCEITAPHAFLFPIPLNLSSPFSEDYVGFIWPQRVSGGFIWPHGCQEAGTLAAEM